MKDYLQFFDTPAPVHRITPFPRHEKEMEKEKGGKKHYLSVGDQLYVVISSEENIPLLFRNLIAEFDKK